MSSFRDLLEGKIDFHGQKQVDNIARIVLIASTILSFVLGFALQSIWVSMETFVLCTIILALGIVPPWSRYNAHAVKWASATESKSK